MLTKVREIIAGKKPVIAHPEDALTTVIQRMFDNDYSQLPVVGEDERPIGMVTPASILRAQMHFNVPLSKLRAADAIDPLENEPLYHLDDDLLLMLDRLRDVYAVAVVESNGKLAGIVTAYDATEYLGRQAKDMMLVRRIETTLKDFIYEANRRTDGQVDTQQLALLSEQASGERKTAENRVREAIRRYIDCLRQADVQVAVDPQLVDEVIRQLNERSGPKSINDLNFGDYASLLLHPSLWGRLGQFFPMGREAISSLLDGVRKTRNDLAHFRDDIQSQQRDQLQYFVDWLRRSYQPIMDVLAPSEIVLQPDLAAVANAPSQQVEPAVEINGEELVTGESRYARLALYLQKQAALPGDVGLTFHAIERILGAQLPASARQLRAWWANDSKGHSHSQQWLDAGWRVVAVDLENETVRFERIPEREGAYRSFFSILLSELRREGSVHARLSPSPKGASWTRVVRAPSFGNTQRAALVAAFTRGRRFRVELYIS